MKLSRISKNIILVFLLGLTSFTYAQTGKIGGKVTDKKTGEALIGLTIKVKGDAKGASSNVEGKYILTALAPGKYTLDFTYIGYATKSISDVEVKAGETTTLDVLMEEAGASALKEVVLTTSAKQESANTLYAAQKNNAGISDGISADVIRKSPDKNTSEVLKRVSGTTIQDNKFVIVRGLSDRYNTAQLDNSSLPSTEPNKKAFSFDIVPSNLVDNIVVSKTATPDMPGDFAGGSIKIVTKDIPTENFFSFGVGSSYNEQTTFKNFKSGFRSASDYFGFDDGSRALSSNFPSTTKIVNTLQPENNISAIKSMNRNYNVTNTEAKPGQNYQVSLGRVKDFEKSGNRLGAIVSLTYRNSQQFNPVERKYFGYDYNDDQYRFSTNVGAIANFAYNFGTSKITFKNLYNRIFDDQFTLRRGTNSITSTDNTFYAFDLIEKTIMKSTVEGDHRVGKKNAKIKWTASYSNIINDQPDQRKINYSRNISDRNNPAIGYSANVTSIGKENTRLFSYLNENIYSGELNFSTPTSFLSKSSTFKTGLSSQYRSRDFNVRFLGLVMNPNAPDANAIRERSLNTLFSSDLINDNVYKLDEISNLADRYDANSTTNSGYLMLDNKFGEKIRLVWGARVEKFDLHLKTFDKTKPEVTLNNLDVLPSANFTYNLTAKSNFRTSYYRSVARPEFRELAPFSYYDYELLSTQAGNPALKRGLIDNADIRYEIYPSAGQIFSVSAFYKKFTNPIESYINDINSTPDISYFNAQKADTYGVEVELRKDLSFLNNARSFYKNTTIYTNVALIKSKVSDPSLAGSKTTKIAPEIRPLVGQSPYVINAGISHSALKDNLNFNVLYNTFGRRIFKANGTVFPIIWENPRDVLDFQVGVKVMKKKAEIKLNAGDLLNQPYLFYFDYDLNKKFSTPKDEIINRYKPGRTFSMSLSYQIK